MIDVLKKSDFAKSFYKVGEVCELINVTPQTFRRYDKEGIIKTFRTDGNHRMVYRDELLSFLDARGLLFDDTVQSRKDVVYARVSSHDQKQHGDLDRQALFLIENIPASKNLVVLKEVGSGLNDKRSQIQTLIKMVCNNEVETVYVTYKDRLTRFGYNYLETVFASHGTRIAVIKDEGEAKSVQMELVEDMMSLVASFSGKLYGMRSRKNKIEAKENERN